MLQKQTPSAPPPALIYLDPGNVYMREAIPSIFSDSEVYSEEWAALNRLQELQEARRRVLLIVADIAYNPFFPSDPALDGEEIAEQAEEIGLLPDRIAIFYSNSRREEVPQKKSSIYRTAHSRDIVTWITEQRKKLGLPAIIHLATM